MAAAAKKSQPKSEAIVTDPKQKALLHAIATGNTEGVDMVALKELVANLGLGLVAKGVQTEKYSRIEKRRQWLTAKGVSEDEKVVLKDFAEVAGTGPRILDESEARDFTQGDIDALMKEELTRREVEDIAKGDYDPIRATILNYATYKDPSNDPFATGTFASPANGYKFTVTKQQRGGNADYSKLEEVLKGKWLCEACGGVIFVAEQADESEDGQEVWSHQEEGCDDPTPEQTLWDSITNKVTAREVDETKLAEALGVGTVGIEAFAAVVPDKTTVRMLRVDPIKEGDAL